jgi:hypothetical protein
MKECFDFCMAASKRSLVRAVLAILRRAFRIKKLLKKGQKRDGVRKSSLLRSGREKSELKNGDGDDKHARQQRGTRETIFIIRTGGV